MDSINNVFWLWTTLLVVHGVALGIAAYHRETIVPPLYKGNILPWPYANILFRSIVSVLSLLIVYYSFKNKTFSFFSPESEVSFCLSGMLALIYLFFSLRSEDRMANRIDDIIDGFLYLGVSKEESYHQLSNNRMGYSVLKSFEKELALLEEKLNSCSHIDQEIDEMSRILGNGSCSSEQLVTFQDRVGGYYVLFHDLMGLVIIIEDKQDRIRKVSPSLEKSESFDAITKVTFSVMKAFSLLMNKTAALSDLLFKKRNVMFQETLSSLVQALDKIKELNIVNDVLDAENEQSK